LGQLVYDAARVRENRKAVQLLAHLQARYPQIGKVQFIYTASGQRGELSVVLTEGMRLERVYARPMDENSGLENLPYNIPRWDSENLNQLSQATAAVAKVIGACQSGQPSRPAEDAPIRP